MLTLHLVRHGDTVQAAEGIFSGDLDPPLTDSGLDQAERVGRAVAAFKPVAIYCSPKLRARQTAEPMARLCNLEPTIEDGLREIAYGSWEGRKETEIHETERAQFEAWRADPGLESPPGGETAFAIAARAMPVVARVLRAHRSGDVVLVSHKATVRIMACALLEVPIARFRTHISCPTTSITSFELSNGGAMLVRAADVHHLA